MEDTFNNYYVHSNPTITQTSSSELSGSDIMMMLLIFLAVFVVAYIILSIFRQKIFQKAGVKGWKAWVPFYNSYVLLQLGGQKGWWIFFALFPPTAMLTTVFMYIAEYHIQRKLGKSEVYLVLAILLQPVWLGILAFDKSTWDDTKGAKRLDTQDQNQLTPVVGQPAAPMSPRAPVEPIVSTDSDTLSTPVVPTTPEASAESTSDEQPTPPIENK